MQDSTELFPCVILFCASAILHLCLQNKRNERESSEEDIDIDDNASFDAKRFTKSDAILLCNPLNSIPPHIQRRLSHSFIGNGNGFNKSSTDKDETVWNHFECFDEGNDDGHRIINSLSTKSLEQCRSGVQSKRSSLESNISTWDAEMAISPSSSIDADLDNCGHRPFLPNKLILVRHGQSEGNVNEKIYASKPDNSLNLTELGWDQAKMAGKALKQSIIGTNETIHFIVSPYVRTMETFHGILSAWCDPAQFKHIHDKDERLLAWYAELLNCGITWSEDPRVREQDFGNYQNPDTIKRAKAERHNFGSFYYRFPHGESASDVFDRVSTFLDSLWRSFQAKKSTNYVIVTHGISIRVFLARYFRYTVDQFNMLENPKNGELVVLTRDGNGKLKLSGRSQLIMEHKVDSKTGEKKNKLTGYTFHKKLRCYAVNKVRRRQVKLSFDDY